MSALTSFMRTRHPRCAGRNSIRRAITEALEARQFLTSVVVNTTADQVDPAGSATVSLRDAIAIANASTTPTAITFDPTVFASRQTITLTVGTRLILQNASEPITVTGPAEPLTISGNNATGIFVVWNGTTASISNLILTAGKSGNGAGIDSYGNSTVSNVSITKSSANYGGAIFNSGNLNLSDSTLSGNSATYGGAFSDAAGGTATLTNVTIANNNATYGGGISNGLSGETGSTTLADDTIAANSSNAGGGIFNYPGTGDVVTLGNTIVADNGGTASTAVGPDVDGQVSSQGFDLIDQSNGSTGWTNQDLTGTEASPLNPELAALGNYGGDQQTVFLFSNSPAIGAGSVSLVPGGITTDERGLPRNFNGKVDIGAVEVQPNDATPTTPISPVVPPVAPTPPVTLPTVTALGQGTTASPGPVLDTASPTFQWDAVTGFSGLTGYQINLYDQTLGKGYTYKVGTSVTSYTAPSSVLAAGDKFVWNVRIIDGTQTGPESAYLYFQAPAAVVLPAPVATGPGSTSKPGDVLTTSTPTLSWNAVTGVTGMTGYQIYLTDLTASKTYSYQVGASATSFAVPSGTLTAGDDFVWNVRILVGTQSGPPSTYLYFQTPAATVALPAPVATGPGSTSKPGNVLTTSTPTLSWNAVTGVTGMTGYQIYLTDLTASKTYSYQVGASATSFAVPSGTLTAGDDFVWNVRILVGTQSGPPSTYLYFQTPPSTVTLPAPVATGPGSTSKPGDVITTSTPTLSWNAVTGVTGITGYQIYLTDLTASKTYSYQVGASATSFAVPSGTLTAGDDFVWNVRILVGTQSGPPSTYLYFQTPAATVALPAPVATGPGSTSKPGNVLTTSTPTLSWNAVTGVTGMTGYQIYLTDLTASKTYSYQVGASATSFAVPSGTLTAGDDFVWNVRILVGTQSGPPSTYLYFQTPAATVTLPAPVATGPGTTASPGPLLTNDTPTFQWSAVTGVSNLSGYQINVYDQTSKTSYTFKTGASVDSYTVAAGVLTAGDSFVWNVRVLAGGQSGPPSAYLNFQTPAPVSSTPPPQTSAAQITADTEKLTRLEDEQHETVRSLKAAKPGTAKYETLLAKYEVWEKRIKSLKSARAALESDV